MSINKINRVVIADSLKNELDSFSKKVDVQEMKDDIENQINDVISSIIRKQPVDSFDDLRQEYPNAETGWTVTVTDTNITYQYDAEEDIWFPTSINAIPKATEEIDGLMSKESKAKLNTVEEGAEVNYSHEEVFDIVKNQDGEGSGLDADTLRGTIPSDFASSGHLHDGRYYRKSEVDSLLSNKATNSTVNSLSSSFDDHKNEQKENAHNISNITGLQSELDSKETPSGAQSKADEAESNAKSYTDGEVSSLNSSLNSHMEDESNPHNVNKSQIGLSEVTNDEQATKIEFDNHVEDFNDHTSDTTNPHSVTKSQVGLSNVDNVKQATSQDVGSISSLTTSIKTSIVNAINWLKNQFDNHVNDESNPHNVTKSQVGLSNLTNNEQATKIEFNDLVNDFENHETNSIIHVSQEDKNKWDAKETPSGAQSKADQAESSSKSYTDSEISATNSSVSTHIEDKSNPHDVTKSQVGLSNVDNIKQASKEEFDSLKSNFDDNKDETDGHISNFSNPHNVSKSQVGLSNVDNVKQASKSEFDSHVNDSVSHITSSERSRWDGKQDESMKGQVNGYASLDSNAKVPLSQLPDESKGRTYVVANSSERNSLTNLLEGDKAYETSTGDSYIYDGDDWLTLAEANWENVNIEWSNINSKPSSSVSSIDDAVNKRHTHSNKSILDDIEEAYSTSEKNKLSGIEVNANNYTHPSTHPASMITTSSSRRFVTDSQINSWDDKAEISDIPTNVSELNNDSNYVTSTELGNAGYGDMTKSTYDSNDNGKVDVAELAESVAWGDVTGKPSSFTPSSHNHSAGDITSGTLSTSRLPSSALIGDTTYSAGTGLSLSGTTFNVNSPFNPSGTYSGLRAQATTKADVGLGSVDNYSRSYYDSRYASSGHNHDSEYLSSSNNSEQEISGSSFYIQSKEGNSKALMEFNENTQSLDFIFR